jgi:hypothetical protein
MEIIVTGRPPAVLQDDYTVSTNEDWFRDYQLKDTVGPIRIEPGWKLFMQLQKLNSGDLAISISTDNQRLTITDRDAGKFGLRVKQADAAQIVPASYTYDIVLVAGDGIYRLAKGSIVVEQGVTNVPGQEKWSHFPLILRP